MFCKVLQENVHFLASEGFDSKVFDNIFISQEMSRCDSKILQICSPVLDSLCTLATMLQGRPCTAIDVFVIHAMQPISLYHTFILQLLQNHGGSWFDSTSAI